MQMNIKAYALNMMHLYLYVILLKELITREKEEFLQVKL